MKIIHIVLNAHIDPIYLWRWEAALDEVLATCRSACDRLDRHPGAVFTRGEAWVYRQIEMLDRPLFERIRRHVQKGQWEIIGGWWIQPDCNQPSGWAMRKQIEIGRKYFLETFGVFPRIGYNVDSFGHSAALPGLMQAAGQDRYIFMRPEPREKELPARLFRWKGYEDGPGVTAYRIAGYGTGNDMDIEYFRRSTTALPEGVNHTMAFVGVGDHGGGPTETQIAWCREHAHDIDDWEIIFSSPSRFFDAVADKIDRLPLVVGELQMHAVGCYSVFRSVKTHMRRAEHLLAQADLAAADPASLSHQSARLPEAWEKVCFHHFHDTLGGTCIPSAYAVVADQLGLSCSVGNEILTYTLRRKMASLPDDARQRIVLWNAEERPFSGFVEFEPWFEPWFGWKPLGAGSGLVDEAGSPVPHQIMRQEAAHNDPLRLLFRIELAPRQVSTIQIVRGGAAAVAARVEASADRLSNRSGVALTADSLHFGDRGSLPRPEIEVIDDPTDTWSHGIDRYSNDAAATARWLSRRLVDSGPLMASWIETGAIGDASTLTAEWRLYAGEPFVSLDLTVDYREHHRLLKLTLPLSGAPETRADGVMNGSLKRINDGAERPLRDWLLVGGLGIVCPDVYAADATPERVRLTLLRSPLMAHHDPYSGELEAPRHVYSDQGVHHFRLRFYKGDAITESILDSSALELQRPPITADLTRGMR